MDNQKIDKGNFNQEEETIDLRKLFNYFIGNIHWFIISVVIALTIAFVLNRYAARIYNISTTVLIEDDNKDTPWMTGSGPGMDLTQGFGMFPSLQNFENQTIILQSYSQVKRTVDNLNFSVSYFGQGRVISREIYKDSPFEIIFNKSHPQPLGVDIVVEINNDGFIDVALEAEKAQLYQYENEKFLETVGNISFEDRVKPGKRIKTDFCDFSIKINENFDPESDNNYYFKFNASHYLTLAYQNRLVIEPISKGSSMIRISMQDSNPQKAIDFLNELTTQYLLRNLEKKNEFAERTIEFIDQQLSSISDSLLIAEETLQQFRSKNKVMNLSFQAEQVFEEVQELENQRQQFEMQYNYYNYLLSYIEENQDVESVLAPSAMGVQDPLLNALILEINQLSVEKSSMINVKKSSQLSQVRAIDAQIRNAKKTIYENAKNLVKGARLSLEDINSRLDKLAIEINNLPETERKLFGIERKFKLNDDLYTYLLERRAEVQIAKASNTSDNEVIDFALITNNGHPIKPKTLINYIIALLMGFVLPAIVIALREYFSMKIDSPDMVKKITNHPIIGHIPSCGATEMKIFDDPDAPWAEAFRIVRTKLQFITKDKKPPTMLVTSSIPGEGKSFVSINMASAYALTGKKTVLVGFDLRRPQIAQRFNIDKNLGVTNYLIGEANYKDIIKTTEDPNLSVIASGIIPPNPAELIGDQKTLDFIERLKKDFDYIVLDTAPMSPVSDTHYLSRIVDATVFVVRDQYTHKHAFEASIEEANNNGIQNICILMNDIQLKKKRYGYKYGYSYGYKYGYKYGYGYGYGYYKDDEKKNKKK